MYTEAWMVLLLKQGDETPCGHQTPPSMEALGCGGGGGGGDCFCKASDALSLATRESCCGPEHIYSHTSLLERLKNCTPLGHIILLSWLAPLCLPDWPRFLTGLWEGSN